LDALPTAAASTAQRTEDEGEQAAADAAADLLADELRAETPAEPSAPATAASVARAAGPPLISSELASQRIGPKILAALREKFNGSLTDIRYPDENDMLF
jgi:hypothetical protein